MTCQPYAPWWVWCVGAALGVVLVCKWWAHIDKRHMIEAMRETNRVMGRHAPPRK